MAIDIQSLLQQLQEQYTRANTDSLAQYQNLMRGVNQAGLNIAGTYNDAFKNLEGAGTTAKTDIARNATRQKGAASQDLISRGLGNTTVTATNNRGIEDDAARQTAAVDESVRGQRIGLGINRANSQMGVANLWANSVLSRQNQGPDPSMYANLIQSLAANGGLDGSGGGGGGGRGRSYNFVGGVPRGGNSAINTGSVGGGGEGGGGGVQTFTNPNAIPGHTITASGGGDGWQSTGVTGSGSPPRSQFGYGAQYRYANGQWQYRLA